ncbi:glycoside hydrolase family 95 protein [Thermostilla marina]
MMSCFSGLPVRRRVLWSAAVVLLFLFTSDYAASSEWKLWYRRPAVDWNEGLPVGNGRLLGVVYGGVAKETIQLNEDTLWTGQPIPRDKPDGARFLPIARELAFQGKYYEAERLIEDKMLGLRLEFGMHTYQTLGNLTLRFEYAANEEPNDYRRELDLDTAITTVEYRLGKVKYRRECFSSAVDQILVLRTIGDRPGSVNCTLDFTRPKADVRPQPDGTLVVSGVATGKTVAGWRGVHYCTMLRVLPENGRVTIQDGRLRVEACDAFTILLAAATDYYGDDPRLVCESRIRAAAKKSYRQLRESHIVDHQRFFRRVKLRFSDADDEGESDARDALPTDERLAAFRAGTADPQLIALFFHLGRYILITASRPGSMPINLWGKWVQHLDPPYNADYHININIQMNYWPAEIANLSECHEPFFDLLDRLRPRGRITARETYGCRGFTAHHATDAWYFTAAVGNPPYAVWPMAPAWMCTHLWNHYRYTLDREFLEDRAYPIMREAAEFFVDYLVEDPRTGYLVTGPSTSPENRFISPRGHVVSVSMGPTMDIELVGSLFDACISASQILGKDAEFRDRLAAMKRRLPPLKINSDGRLAEWSEPFQEQNPGHRHISHLWGLCPGDLIDCEKTPALFEAARKALDVRVANGAAASPEYRGITAWVIASYVRLLDGDRAYALLREMLAESTWDNLFVVGVRGRERQVFETDANLGACAAIAEMLVQSHSGEIRLLPALPTALSNGYASGLCAQGGFEIDLQWTEGRLRNVVVRSKKGSPCTLVYRGHRLAFATAPGGVYRWDGQASEPTPSTR